MARYKSNQEANSGCILIIVIAVVIGLIGKTCNDKSSTDLNYSSGSTNYMNIDTGNTERISDSTAYKKSKYRRKKEKTYSSNSVRQKNKKNNSRRSSARNLIRGPRGGCYYINENGNKVYVDRSLCN